MDGFVQGAEAARTVLVQIRAEYTAGVRGEPIGNVTVVIRNAAGQAQHIVGNYRPRSTLLRLSRLVSEKLAGTPYAGHFLASES